MAQSETRVSPAQLAHYLRGIKFPASKRELKADAKKNQAPPEILKFINELPEEQYRTMAEVTKAVGEIEWAEATTKHPRLASFHYEAKRGAKGRRHCRPLLHRSV